MITLIFTSVSVWLMYGGQDLSLIVPGNDGYHALYRKPLYKAVSSLSFYTRPLGNSFETDISFEERGTIQLVSKLQNQYT